MSERIEKNGDSQIAAEDFADDPFRLRDYLTSRGTLEFSQYPSGMFPASVLDQEIARQTGMGMAWFRDTAHIANALYDDRQTRVATNAATAMLSALCNTEHVLDDVRAGDMERRLPVRFDGETLENDREPRRQNDATGYALWSIGRIANDGALYLSDREKKVLAKTADYLGDIRYWQDADEGHWEEDRRVQVASIGAAIAGLREMDTLLEADATRYDMKELMQKGYAAIDAIMAYGVTDFPEHKVDENPFYPEGIIEPHMLARDALRTFSIQRRRHDAALLFLVEPLDIFDAERSRQIVQDTDRYLARDRGIARYAGDTYWAPRFPALMSIEERTTQAEGRTEKRNQLAAGIYMTDSEAQWTLFDSLLSAYWGKQYQKDHDPNDRKKQLYYLDRSLQQLHEAEDGRLLMPEAYYHDYVEGTRNRLVPNDHMPLTWSTANLLRAIGVFERTR